MPLLVSWWLSTVGVVPPPHTAHRSGLLFSLSVSLVYDAITGVLVTLHGRSGSSTPHCTPIWVVVFPFCQSDVRCHYWCLGDSPRYEWFLHPTLHTDLGCCFPFLSVWCTMPLLVSWWLSTVWVVPPPHTAHRLAVSSALQVQNMTTTHPSLTAFTS